MNPGASGAAATLAVLLDVNVIIALLDPSHVHHERAHEWFGAYRESEAGRWATCPIVENGVVRVVSHPGYPGRRAPAREVADLLGKLTAASDHTFWPESISLLDARHVEIGKLSGHAQITDAYLLALAVHHGGKLATFDRRVPIGAVPEAEADSVVRLG